MTALLGIVGMVAVAAVTPGPNNLIVLRTASRLGVARTLPAIVGVVLGGLAVLVVAAVVTGPALEAPGIRRAAGLVGCAYLAWLGLRLIQRAGCAEEASGSRGLPAASVSGLFAFQFVNPKSWVMVVTAIGAMPVDGAWSRWPLAVAFTAIPAACLLLWAITGAALARLLAHPRVAQWVDRTLGGLLIATAIALADAA